MNSAIDSNIRKFFKGFLVTDPYSDPTYIGFKLIFNFEPISRNPETGLTDDALFATDGGLDSAMNYLRATGNDTRAEHLKQFKELLKQINEQMPWYFQTLSGLDELWKIDFEQFNPYRGKNKIIEISCLESIDLKMTALADLYRKAVYDYKYMRWLVPENLRLFSLTIQLAEMRSFHEIIDNIDSIDSKQVNENANTENLSDKNHSDNTATFASIDNLISVLEFHLSHCEFDFNESFLSDKTIAMNGDAQMATQKFKIKTRHISEKHSFTILDIITNDKNINSGGGIPNFDNAFNNRGNNILSNAFATLKSDATAAAKQLASIPGNLIGGALNSVGSKLTSAQLGNVYGNPNLTQLINGFVNKAEQIDIKSALGNVYSNLSFPHTLPPPTGNVYTKR